MLRQQIFIQLIYMTESEQKQTAQSQGSSEVMELVVADEGEKNIERQELLYDQLMVMASDSTAKDKYSRPLNYYIKFGKENVDTIGFGTLTNVLFYASGPKITRLNIDSMRRKFKQGEVTQNLPMEQTKDLRELTKYDPDYDDVRFLDDQKSGKASHTVQAVDQSDSTRKVLKIKVLEKLGYFIVLLSALEQTNDCDFDVYQKQQGYMQVYNSQKMIKVLEHEISASILEHPNNIKEDEKKFGPRNYKVNEWHLNRKVILHTQAGEKNLLTISLISKVVFFNIDYQTYYGSKIRQVLEFVPEEKYCNYMYNMNDFILIGEAKYIDLQRLAEKDLQDFNLNADYIFEVPEKYNIESIFRATQKNGQEQINILPGYKHMLTFNLPEESKAEEVESKDRNFKEAYLGGWKKMVTYRGYSKYNFKKFYFPYTELSHVPAWAACISNSFLFKKDSKLRKLEQEKTTELFNHDDNGHPIFRSARSIEGGMIIQDCDKILLYQGMNPKAVAQRSIAMAHFGQGISGLSPDGKIIQAFHHEKSLQLFDSKNLTVLFEVTDFPVEFREYKNRLIGESFFLSPDLSVFPLAKDSEGQKYIRIVDLALGEHSSSNLHNEARGKKYWPFFQTSYNHKYYSFVEQEVSNGIWYAKTHYEKDAEVDRDTLDVSTENSNYQKPLKYQIINTQEAQIEFEYIANRVRRFAKVQSQQVFIHEQNFKWIIKKKLFCPGSKPKAIRTKNLPEKRYKIQVDEQDEDAIFLFTGYSNTVYKCKFEDGCQEMEPEAIELTYQQRFDQHLIDNSSQFICKLIEAEPDSDLAKKFKDLDINKHMGTTISKDCQLLVYGKKIQKIYNLKTQEKLELNEQEEFWNVNCYPEQYWMTRDFIVRDVQSQSNYQFFCTKTGNKIASLSFKKFTCLLNHSDSQTSGNYRPNKICETEVVGVLDKKTQRVFSPSIQTILHLAEVDTCILNLKNISRSPTSKIQIYGSVAPACVPKLVYDFKISDKKERDILARQLLHYTLCKNNGTDSICTLENILHFMSKRNSGKRLQTLIKNQSDQITYMCSPFSPISSSTILTFKQLMSHINSLPIKTKINIFQNIDLYDITHVATLRKEDLELFFTSMNLPLKQKQRYNPFDQTLAVLTNDPYIEINSINDLNTVKGGRFSAPEQLQEWTKALIKSSEDQPQAVEYFFVMTPLFYVPGSQLSIQFLKIISEKPQILSLLYHSEAATKIIYYKFKLAKNLGFGIAAAYCCYILCLVFCPRNWNMLFWFALQSTIQAIRLQGQWQGSFKLFVKQVGSFWNILNASRLLLLLTFIIYQAREETSKNVNAALYTVSWITLLPHLRLFQSFGFILTLLPSSLKDMSAFFVVLLLVNTGFMFGYAETLETDMSETELHLSTQIISWFLIFGDFAQIQFDSGMQIALFFFWTIALPLLSMNLLIAFLSDTYERVYDQRDKANFIEIVNLIQDLEILMLWNRNKNSKSTHLLYAKEIEEEQKENDVTMGIGQKVSNVGKKINAKIDSAIREQNETIIATEKKLMENVQQTKSEMIESLSEIKESMLSLQNEIKEIKTQQTNEGELVKTIQSMHKETLKAMHEETIKTMQETFKQSMKEQEKKIDQMMMKKEGEPEQLETDQNV